MPKTFNRVADMPINQKIITRPSISIGHLKKQLDEFNRQYHDFNKLHLSADDLGHSIQVNFINIDGIETQVTDWLNME